MYPLACFDTYVVQLHAQVFSGSFWTSKVEFTRDPSNVRSHAHLLHGVLSCGRLLPFPQKQKKQTSRTVNYSIDSCMIELCWNSLSLRSLTCAVYYVTKVFYQTFQWFVWCGRKLLVFVGLVFFPKVSVGEDYRFTGQKLFYWFSVYFLSFHTR